MKRFSYTIGIFFLMAMAIVFWQCEKDSLYSDQNTTLETRGKGGSKGGRTELAGNNLSYPVLWTDGYAKLMRGSEGVVLQDGEWWYVWGEDPIDPNYPIFSCQPNPANPELCLSGEIPGDGISPVFKAFIQKDALNEWQAENIVPVGETYVDLIDWGDNLESVDWYTKSQVRTEVVLYKNVVDPMLQYEMRHVSGWGTNEVHGMKAEVSSDDPYVIPCYQPTVYSHCARLLIQKLNVPREAVPSGALVWIEGEGWTEADGITENLINPPIFNGTVYEGGDGPGYYAAEVNVKGKIVYGYTWNVKTLNEGAGDYRITFSLDNLGPVALNTHCGPGTGILMPVEEVFVAASEGTGGGAQAFADAVNDLTYMDVRILNRTGGGNKPSKKLPTFSWGF